MIEIAKRGGEKEIEIVGDFKVKINMLHLLHTLLFTVCPTSLVPVYIETYYIK